MNEHTLLSNVSMIEMWRTRVISRGLYLEIIEEGPIASSRNVALLGGHVVSEGRVRVRVSYLYS
jgi:hypothetical protein